MVVMKRARNVLAVKDLDASVAFYRDMLGFAIDVKYEGWCFLNRDSVYVMLGHCPDEMPASRINDHSYFAYVEVQGIDDLHAEFLNRGLTSISSAETKSWGMREFMVTTPDGHRIMFGEDTD
ncbi:MAG: VOC family protein [Burkholderiales bacterium]|nr:MAG: VOC family protein [Burkholderiales bacterium]